jgi:two-component system response regulator PilR (NtrC family)
MFGIQAALIAGENMKPQSDALTSKRILLVEDERVVREALRLLLSRDAHTVVEANNGAEAMALFHKERFDLVITDYEIPFVKGNELAAQIKRVVPQQPVLMITAYPHRPGSDNPVDALVTKPYVPASLREVIAKLLAQPAETPTPTNTADLDLRSPSFETEIIPV